MGIVDEDIRAAREAVPLVDLISRYTEVKKTGRAYKALCPFHNEKSPSLSINPDAGVFFCFGCQASGDAITFLQEIEHVDFATAVERLATIGGITIRYDDDKTNQRRRVREEQIHVLRQAVAYYQQALNEHPHAMEYLTGRGITQAEIDRYSIGFAPTARGRLAKALPDVSAETLRDVGLLYLNDGQPSDVFRDRITFPIFDPIGDPVGVAGRLIARPDGTMPQGGKYINPTGTRLYDKSRVLYGLNWAKAEAARRNEIIVCEGYTDVIGMHRVGYPNAIAGCGTAFTDQHARILRRYADRIILAYDADEAGQAAAARFVEWQHDLGLNVDVATFPNRTVEVDDPDNPGSTITKAEKTDPWDLATSDPDTLKRSLSSTRPLLDHLIAGRIAEIPEDAPIEQRVDAGLTIMKEIVDKHQSAAVRTDYLMQIARDLRIHAQGFMDDYKRRPTGPDKIKRSALTNRPPDDDVRFSEETEGLRVLLAYPEDITEGLAPWMFTHPICLAAYEHIRDNQGLPTAELINTAEPAVADLVNRLLFLDTPLPTGVYAYQRLLEAGTNRYFAHLRTQARLEHSLTITKEMGDVQMDLDRLRDGESDPAFLDTLWLRLNEWASTQPDQTTTTNGDIRSAVTKPPAAPDPQAETTPQGRYEGYDEEAGW